MNDTRTSDPLTANERAFIVRFEQATLADLETRREFNSQNLRLILLPIIRRLAPPAPTTDTPFRVGDRVITRTGFTATVDEITDDGIFGPYVVRWDVSHARASRSAEELTLYYDAPQPPAAPERDAPHYATLEEAIQADNDKTKAEYAAQGYDAELLAATVLSGDAPEPTKAPVQTEPSSQTEGVPSERSATPRLTTAQIAALKRLIKSERHYSKAYPAVYRELLSLGLIDDFLGWLSINDKGVAALAAAKGGKS